MLGAQRTMIQTLDIQDMRVFEYARLTYTPGFNVLVGANGSGLTTVLDAISSVLRGSGAVPGNVRKGAFYLQVDCTHHGGGKYQICHPSRTPCVALWLFRMLWTT